eukprot:jgi/Psemu1/43659/gm1.43659_g
MPETSSTDRLLMILQDLKEVTNKPHPPIPYVEQGTQINEALRNIQDLLQIGAQEPLNMEPNTKSTIKPQNVREPPRVPAPQQRSARQGHPWAIETIIRKKFNKGWFEGEVVSYDQNNQYYQVKFTDGDLADYTHDEISRHYKSDQYYSKPKDKPKALMGMYLRASVPCGGSIWDDDLNKWAAYPDLIKHPKAAIQELWLKSGKDKFGRLFQGFQPNNIEGMDVLDWINRCDVPIHKKVTYPGYTVAIRPEKADPYRTRITAGGDQLEYHGEVST